MTATRPLIPFHEPRTAAIPFRFLRDGAMWRPMPCEFAYIPWQAPVVQGMSRDSF
jgi:hypothetical protein